MAVQCSGDQVLIAKCKKPDCTKCAPAIPNPYGYSPGKCVSDFLRVVCTKEKVDTAGGGGSSRANQAESDAKARIKALNDGGGGSSSRGGSAEVEAKQRIQRMQEEL